MIEYNSQDLIDVLSGLTARLGVQEIKEGSFLYNLGSAIKAEKDSGTSSTTEALANIHIDTCSKQHDTYFANDIGVVRMEVPYIALLASDNMAYFETPDGSEFPDFLLGQVLLQKGQSISYGKLSITADEDWVVPSGTNRLYVACTISASQSVSFSSNTSVRLITNNDYMKYVVFKISQNINFTYVNESDAVFKSRVIMEIRQEGLRTPAYIKSYLESIYGIRRVTLNEDTKTIYFVTDEMTQYGEGVSTDKYKKILQAEILSLLVWPNTYEIVPSDKATLYATYSIVGANTSVNDINTEIFSVIETLVDSPAAVTTSAIEKRIKNVTGTTIKIQSMYVEDSITGAKIYDWATSNDLYIFVSADNITEV